MRASLFETLDDNRGAARFVFGPEPSRDNPASGAAGRARLLSAFLAIALVTFLLRIFYSTHLYQDDGLWFTAAEELLRGKALYREIYFDKPPGLALVYAGLFKVFGAHILTIRLFTIAYSLAISGVLYLFGAWLYGGRTGLVAAAMFAVFSTTYTAGHVQGLNTDFMMALPYTAGAYLLIRSRADVFHKAAAANHSAWSAFAGGVLVGIASQVNPKAIFDLIFFALALFIARRGALKSMALAVAGFAAGAAPFLIYVAAGGALLAYWHYVWEWGSLYASYYPAAWAAVSALRQTADYFALNNTLLAALIFVAVTATRRALARRRRGAKLAPGAGSTARAMFVADATMLLWFAVSYSGVALGGRFFGHYFYQIIPALCLIGARGVMGMARAVAARGKAAREAAGGRPGERGEAERVCDVRGNRALKILSAALILGFAFTLVRFHGRTVVLASDWARGVKSAQTTGWLHERLNREERRVAAQVKNMDGAPDVADRLGTEAMRGDSPRATGAEGPSDYLFVWGYRPEIYYWSGLVPASRYLSTQPLTGVPGDVHYFADQYRSLLEDQATAAARAELLGDLERTRPEYIIDELGAFNSGLAIMNYPELREFMDGYKSLGMVERFVVYRRKDFTKNYRRRNPGARP
ncbi:MAG: ArnT family glycosyltransferase [Blastocatellia bacterium]